MTSSLYLCIFIRIPQLLHLLAFFNCLHLSAVIRRCIFIVSSLPSSLPIVFNFFQFSFVTRLHLFCYTSSLFSTLALILKRLPSTLPLFRNCLQLRVFVAPSTLLHFVLIVSKYLLPHSLCLRLFQLSPCIFHTTSCFQHMHSVVLLP